MSIMNKLIIKHVVFTCTIAVALVSCKTTSIVQRDPQIELPETYATGENDTTNTAELNWRDYFHDPMLNALIDSALNNNQELNIALMEIAIAQNEVMSSKGEYLPSVGLTAGAGVDKVGRYTTHGAFEATTEMEPGKEIPEAVPDFLVGAVAKWEVDIWRKLRNAKDAAVKRFLADQEGRNFMVTNLVAEIADSYYELLALDNQMEILNQNITLQENALRIVKMQKEATRVTELAVKRFEAELMNTKSLQFEIKQDIVELENRINFLVGRMPQKVERDASKFDLHALDTVNIGTPAQLLENRPDIRKAELELEARKLDVKVARANFYPSLGIDARVGINAFDPKYLINPESLIYSVAGELMAPLLNRKAIKAEYQNANAKQMQAVLDYEQTLLNAYVEVANQVSRINNLKQSVNYKGQQVEAMLKSIQIANNLFQSAHADYMEVLLTQRDALEARFELIDLKMEQLHSKVYIYRALGGGWR